VNRRFRLRTLHRLRERRLDAAAGELAKARWALAEAQAQHRTLTEAVHACIAPAHATPEQLSGAAVRRDLLRQRVHRAAETVQRRHDELCAALDAWRGARTELRAVEALHERHRQAVAAGDARREQRQADDLASVAVLQHSVAEQGDGPGGDAA